MNDNEIKKFIAQQLAKNVNLSDIQKMVNAEFKVKLTFMDIRVLASELDNIDWSVNDPKAIQKAKDEAKKAAEKKPEGEADAEAKSGTVIEVSKLIRPGTMASGSVKFASGPTAEWYVDQTGRLGLDKLEGGQPTPEDIKEFQLELQKAFGQ